jgi:sortase B
MSKKRTIVLVLCLLVIAVSAGYLVHYYVSQKQGNQVYEELQEQNTTDPADLSDQSGEVSEEQSAQPEPYECPIDFEALWEINPDIYAWIEIPDTELAYPIVQHESDDYYYLNRTIEGAEGLPGSIYTDSFSQKDFSRFNTVIYGHNMINETMFGSLRNYRDESYLDEHREIRIYTPDELRIYRVFAAVIYDDTLITAAYDDDDVKDRQAFLDSIFDTRDLNSHVMDDVEVTTEDNIITLSTCIHDVPDKRYLVEAVLVDEQR